MKVYPTLECDQMALRPNGDLPKGGKCLTTHLHRFIGALSFIVAIVLAATVGDVKLTDNVFEGEEGMLALVVGNGDVRDLQLLVVLLRDASIEVGTEVFTHVRD